MEKQQLSKNEVIDLVLNRQLLNGQNNLSPGRTGIGEIISHLGYIQIDTISVINRAHNHILWTRNHKYSKKHLHDLQTKDKSIFEYWTHAMSYVPMEDYRFSLNRMNNFRKPKSRWIKHRYDQSKKYFKPVLERVKNEGPLSSSNFENDTGKKGGNWWDWKPAKTALEYLFWLGELMVAERRGFQKYYDLTERVLPGNINTTLPTEEELNRFFILRALKSLGVATEKEIQKFMQPGTVDISDMQVTKRKTMHKIINEMCEAGEIINLQIENDKVTNYVLPETLSNIKKRKTPSTKVHFLSPFDNLIIQRERTKRIFNFDYTIECYVPEPKRKYGYFVLPILWKNNFIGRMDTKADRKSKQFIVNNLVFENSFNDYDGFLPRFTKELNNFAKFNNCDSIIINKCLPSKLKSKIKTELKTIRIF